MKWHKTSIKNLPSLNIEVMGLYKYDDCHYLMAIVFLREIKIEDSIELDDFDKNTYEINGIRTMWYAKNAPEDIYSHVHFISDAYANSVMAPDYWIEVPEIEIENKKKSKKKLIKQNRFDMMEIE